MLRMRRLVPTLVALIVITGCAIDASSPTERIEPERISYFGPVTHNVVCRCTCRSDSGDRTDESSEMHAIPESGGCEVLNNIQCELDGSNDFGTLESCFKKSVRISD